MADTDTTRALAKAREAGNLAYGYFVALVNHGGETEAAAKKGRDHLQVALVALASAPDAGLCHTSTAGNADAETRHNVADAARQAEALVAMVYVHPCNCGDGIPQGMCARCRAVKVLGFDPWLAAAAAGDTSEEPT